MLTRYNIIDKQFVASGQNSGCFWVLNSPDARERAQFQEKFRLDDYDLASIFDEDEVPRLDIAEGRLLLIWKTPESAVVSESVELGVNVVGMALVEDCVALAYTKGNVFLTDREFRNVRDSRDAMLAFLLRSVRHFIGHLKVIKQISKELEKKITVSMENSHLLQMFSLSEDLVYYLDAMETNAAVLARLRTIGERYGFEARHLEVLDDIILENTQATRQTRIFSTVLSGLMDARGTIVNNNMNVLLKNLTLINIVFLPLNLIASIGGMSEWSMMTQGVSWKVSYALFLIGMLLFGWTTWVIMKKLVDKGSVKSKQSMANALPKSMGSNRSKGPA
ncbi:MAG TPA: magnesium transporter CorA family protein [Smithellaceae bacterium]|nr:magnesium transporter CorA family protein [Smithellaceae bacterium]